MFHHASQVVASCLDSLEPILLEDFEDKEDLVACLKASANVPRIAGDPVEHRYVCSCPELQACSPCRLPLMWQSRFKCLDSIACLYRTRIGWL